MRWLYHVRPRDLRLVLRAACDFVVGFRALRQAGPCVTVFGSARVPEDHPYYELGRTVGRRLAEAGFAVMTGGGPGLMEAANRGARDAGGLSLGCNIELPAEQSANPYLDRFVTCRQFFSRKVLLFKNARAFVALPGGFGTMDELFEALTLVQTGRIEPLPIVLMGEDYWKPVAALLDQMAATALIAPSDVRLAMITNDVDDAVRFIRERTRDVTPAPREGTPRVARWTAGFGAGFAIRTRGPAGRAWR